jgi:shikimate dehydrogenase
MNRYALVGKNISHSRSPEIYYSAFKEKIGYDLLDYHRPEEIPKAVDLFEIYSGINITSPYKKHFLKEVVLTKNAQTLGSINCLKKEDDKIIGENTDFLAIVDILNDLFLKYPALEIVILGDGVMSEVVQAALLKLTKTFVVLSRKNKNLFEHSSLITLFKNHSTPLIINTCARQFVFRGDLPPDSIFWDFNYDFLQHSDFLTQKNHRYLDGLDLLLRQASYAQLFWSLPSSANLLI